MRLALAAVVLLLTGAASRAEALTIRDVIELTKAGISEEVLLALIDVEGGVYANDTETLKALKQAGVSERVMIALVRSGRERPLPEPPPPPVSESEVQAPPPQVVVVEHHEPPQQVVVPVPVYVPVYTAPVRSHRGVNAARGVRTIGGDFAPSNYVPFAPALPVIRQQETKPTPPVYWGFGGKRRPDTWDPSPWEREPSSDGGRRPNPKK